MEKNNIQQTTEPITVRSFSSMIFGFLQIVEKLAWVVAAVGLLFKYLHYPGANELLLLSLAGLAGVFFLFAYRPAPKVTSSETKLGFADLLFSTIMPKVAWIGCAVLALGVLFGLLHLAGSNEMLMIGIAAGGFALFLILIGMAQGNERVKAITPVLYRLVPMLGTSVYFMMR